MEQNEIEQLIQDGELWNYLNNRLSQDVLRAYQETFGDVQDLATERKWLTAIVARLLCSGTEDRSVFWGHLQSQTQQVQEPTARNTGLSKQLWDKIERWLKHR